MKGQWDHLLKQSPVSTRGLPESGLAVGICSGRPAPSGLSSVGLWVGQEGEGPEESASSSHPSVGPPWRGLHPRGLQTVEDLTNIILVPRKCLREVELGPILLAGEPVVWIFAKLGF